MLATDVQVVRWTVPAFALIIGLVWYKCYRVGRADPGGTSDSDCSDRSLADCADNDETVSKTDSNYYDSDINIEETYALSSYSKSTEEIVCSPRKRTESMDIPRRKSNSQIAFSRSRSSSPDEDEWHSYAENNASSKMDIQLGSNPTRSNFEAIVRNRSSTFSLKNGIVEPNGKVMNIFEDVAKEEEQLVADEDNSLEHMSYDEEEHETNNECSYHEIEEQTDITPSKDCSKSPAQVLSERDSVIHSPGSGMLEGSVTDENRSERSTDSGKGGSIMDPSKDTTNITTYEFNIPKLLTGRLLGTGHHFSQYIEMTTQVNIQLNPHPSSVDLWLCCISGTPKGIGVALQIIRQRFPQKRFPEMTLEQIMPFDEWLMNYMHLTLVEGINNDVVVCHIIKPNHFFVHLPSHPTFPYLSTLNDNMTKLYNTSYSPPVSQELVRGMIVVANWQNQWVRASVEMPDRNGEQHLLRLVDHGGFGYFSTLKIKKIRTDYLTLPFQAVEVFLANVHPINDKWSQDAYDVVYHFCRSTMAHAQVVGYLNMNTYINLYLNIQNYGVISLTDELIVRKLAHPVSLEYLASRTVTPITSSTT